MVNNKRFFKFITIITCLIISVFSFMIFIMQDNQLIYADNGINFPILNTNSYVCEDNKGYNISGNYGSLFNNTTLTEISLQMTNGTILKGTKNGKCAYGYVIGEEEAEPELKVRLKYNLSIGDNLKINNTNYYISEDTWKSTINGIDGVGVVGTGALIVMKSKTGGNLNSEWTWDNKYSNTDMNCYSTVDFINNFSPKYYSGKPESWTTIKNTDNDYQTIKHNSDGYVTIYTPDGTEMREGIFIKVLFAYEVKYLTIKTGFWGNKVVWRYKNVIEETEFYICNSSVNVLFQNIAFSETSDENKTVIDTDRTELITKAGTIKNGDATNEGFKINTLGNNYKIAYKLNCSFNWKTAYNGQIFTSPGRYDFKVTSQIGNIKETTIYINEQGEQQNIQKYFGKGFITSESHRIFTSNATPTYVAGKTYYEIKPVDKKYIGLVGKIKHITGQEMTIIDKNDSLYDAEKGGEQYKVTDIIEEIAVLTEMDSRKGWKGVLTKSGDYIAEFANNPRYFENDYSGDVYHFVFKFTLTDEEPNPSLNEKLLSTNLCYFDYDPEYFGVTLNSKGVGKVTFAFSYYADAQSFAYEYYLSQIKFENGKYIFQNKEYSSQSDVLKEVYVLSEDCIELKYFDPTNKNSLITIKNAQTEILNLNLQRDVVVMSNMLMPYDSATGNTFLNNKKHYYTDEDGNITIEEIPIRFINITDFESSSIYLVNSKNEIILNIDYGIPIETLLEHNNIPSGIYKIVETNINGYKNEYYATYIKKGDLQTCLNLGIFSHNQEATIPLTKSNANTRYTVNNFVLKSANNALDYYGLVKLKKLGADGYEKYFSLSSIKDYSVDEKGSYELTLIDRMGNYAKYYVDINSSAEIHKLTLLNNEIEYSVTKMSQGQSIELQTLESENNKLEHIGWEDENGNVFTDVYTFISDKDVILKAVWKFKSVFIEVYDGEKLSTKNVKPDTKFILPKVTIQDTDLKLYGFAYKLKDNSYIFYRGQITKVPNVESMTLEAYYVDYNQTYKNNLDSKFNMEFVGWLLETENLKGYILTDDEVTENMIVYALWKKTSKNLIPNCLITGMTAQINKIILITLLLIYNFYLTLIKVKQPAFMHTKIKTKTKNILFKKKENIKIIKKHKIKTQSNRCNIFSQLKKLKTISVISCILCLILVFQPFSNILFNVVEKSRNETKLETIKQQIESVLPKNDPLETLNSKYQIALAESKNEFNIKNNINSQSEDNVNTLTDDELFLEALIILDIVDLEYTVFPAYAKKSDGTKIKGFGYTDYEEFYMKEDDEYLYIGTGFLPLINEEQITEKDIENVVELEPITDENEKIEEVKNKYILTFEETFNSHYVAYDKYVTYSVKDFKIEYIIKENSFENYNLELGYLFDYDNERPIYDPNLNNQIVFKSEAFSIVQGVDYNFTYNTAIQMIKDQDNNFLTIDTIQITYISREALNEFMIHNQDESYLGIPADEIQKLESQLDNTVFYYVDENGELQIAQIPVDAEKIYLKL